MRPAPVLFVVIVVLAMQAFLTAEESRFPARAATIDISVMSGAARVSEEYSLDGSLTGVTLEYLDQPCSVVGSIATTFAGGIVPLEATRRGPWTLFRVRTPEDSTIATALGAVLRIAYDVRLGSGDAAVPIVVPAATLESAGRARGADVTVRLTFAQEIENASVILPRLEPARGSWQARFLAIPSVVRVNLPIDRRCDQPLAGSTGGLEWRFWTFVLTMAIWIPIYFWTIGRRADPA